MIHTRYRRIVLFFARVVASLFVWELVLPRLGLRRLTRRTRPDRLRKTGAGFRTLAIQMGGVLIKVGQFLSARLDVLPAEITAQLAGLQDEVPPEDFADIRQLIEAELGKPLEEAFAEFNEVPLAAASLGQVHQAKLRVGGRGTQAVEESGAAVIGNPVSNVAVKVQRPNIEAIIATDVAALRAVGNWLHRYPPVRRRADVPALLSEFARILYEEIDYLAEGRNAETLAANFRDHAGVHVPSVFWTHTTRRVLTLEDVYAIKITDYDAISAAGIDRTSVAQRLFRAYLVQFFEHGFFHADPHPGNLFVSPGDEGESWRLTFVDFGMVGHVTPNLRAGLRELAIAIGTRDADRLVGSFQTLGFLLPHADVALLVEAETKAFDRFWGKSMSELRNISFQEMHEFAHEFRDLVYDMPFQMPQDLILLGRAVAILSGMCTGLDPQFNFWDSIAPFAQKLLAEEATSGWGFWMSELGVTGRALLALPRRAESVLVKMERGELAVRVPQLIARVDRIELAIRRLVGAVIFAALVMGGLQLHLAGHVRVGTVLLAGAGIALAWAILLRRRKG